MTDEYLRTFDDCIEHIKELDIKIGILEINQGVLKGLLEKRDKQNEIMREALENVLNSDGWCEGDSGLDCFGIAAEALKKVDND